MNEPDLIVLMPVFNDWESAEQLVYVLDGVLADAGRRARVLMVDDGSTTEVAEGFFNRPLEAFQRVDVLQLHRNLGHQRAICVGISYVASHLPCKEVVVMDSDGEDDPHDVPRLLQKLADEDYRKVVFAERVKRSEGWVFAAFYHAYRFLHRFLVGHKVRVGNFSVIPFSMLGGLTVVPELWNHYAAAVFSSRHPYTSVATTRAKRISGRSKMNFTSLFIHGLSALAVFSDRIGIRFLIGGMALVFLTFAAIGTVFAIRLVTDLAIPGWATFTTGILLVSLVQLVTLIAVFSFITLSNRIGNAFIPARDYGYFVKQLCEVWRQE